METMLVDLLVEELKRLITPDLLVQAKQKFVCYLNDQAAGTDTKWDDRAVDIISSALGVDRSVCKAK